MFDIRRCGGDRAACLVVRDLKHAMARIDRELLASAGPGVDRALVGSWRHRSVKRVIRCGSEKEYEKVPAPTTALRLRLSGAGGRMLTNVPDTLPVPSPL